MRKKYSFFIMILFLCCFFASAGKGSIDFVEVEVDLGKNGDAIVTYTIRWKVVSGALHGFYFQDDARLKLEKFTKKRAVDSRGRVYGLNIQRYRRNKWDIVLANGRGVSSGYVTYIFSFKTSFSKAKYLDKTTSHDGKKRMVFHWAPMQWDEAYRQRHYTLRIITPHVLRDKNRESLRKYSMRYILTEKWMNRNYLIDYRKREDGRLEIVLHKKNPGNRFHMRAQFYMPEEWFGSF